MAQLGTVFLKVRVEIVDTKNSGWHVNELIQKMKHKLSQVELNEKDGSKVTVYEIEEM